MNLNTSEIDGTMVMALAGGVLALISLSGRLARRQSADNTGVPYGIAIAAGGLWVLARDYLPLAGASMPAMIGS